MKHSIIIPTAGDAQFLPRLLCSLFAQLDVNSEIIVVENGPQTGTERRVWEFQHIISGPLAGQIKYLHEPVPGSLSGRHRGVFASRGEVLSFFDDDIIVEPGALVALQQAFDEASVDLVGGPSRPEVMSLAPKWLAKLAEFDDHRGFMMTYMSLIDLRVSRIVNVNPDYVFGQNFHIRRSAFDELRGFHPDLYPSSLEHFQGDGETGLTRKFSADGRRADYLDAVAVRHIIPASRLTVDFIARRARFAGIGRAFSQLRKGVRLSASRELVDSVANRRRLEQSLKRTRGSPKQPIKSIEKEGESFLYEQHRCQLDVRNWIRQDDFMCYALPNLGTV